MKPSDNIEKMFTQINIETNTDVDKVVLGDAVNATSKSKQKTLVCNKLDIRRIIMKSKITKLATAACLIFGLFTWYLTVGPTGITLADVQESIASKKWVCIQFNDGAEQWANLQTKQSFYTCPEAKNQNFYAGMRDHVKGLWTYYHTNWGEQIHEETFTPRSYPLTAWNYAMSGWNDTGRPAPDKIERFDDTINDQPAVRFDMYNIGPCGLRSIYRRVWANPETRLPIRIQRYSGLEEFDEGDFTFPESGPSSIYDFGVSQDLEIVNNMGVIEPEAVSIIDAAEQARHSLPTEMRIIDKNFQHNTFSVYYRLGNKFREEFYLPDDYTEISPSLDPPKDPEELHQWAQNNQLNFRRLTIFDGEYVYEYRRHIEITRPPEVNIRVRPHSPDDIDIMTPIRNQWPYINIVGPMKVLYDEPTTPEGCVLLRHAGANLQMDFYLDPQRDYICIKQSKRDRNKNTNEWVKDSWFQQQRSDLSRLPSGQWYALTTTDEGGTELHRDVQLLTDADKERLAELDKTMGFFDGEKLLKEAKANKVKISFWAN